jgi:hypothetical protein
MDRSPDEEKLVARMAEELATREEPITFVLRPLSAIQLAGLLQLALRHPGVPPEGAAAVAAVFVAHVRAYFHDAPATLEVLRMADNPSEDLPV